MSTEPNRLETVHFNQVRREESISKLLIECDSRLCPSMPVLFLQKSDDS
jgi:hypothetical protein